MLKNKMLEKHSNMFSHSIILKQSSIFRHLNIIRLPNIFGGKIFLGFHYILIPVNSCASEIVVNARKHISRFALFNDTLSLLSYPRLQ